MSPPSEVNSWTEYRRLVIQGLRDLDTDMKALTERLDKLELQFAVDITTLKTKAAMWGALGGAIISFLIAVATALVVKGSGK